MIDEVVLVATVIDTMIDLAAMVDVMTTVVVPLEATMITIEEATVAVADEIGTTATAVALESTDMKAADVTTAMVQVVIDVVVEAMNVETIVSEAMVAHHLRVMRLHVSLMVVVGIILLARTDMPEDKLLGVQGPALRTTLQSHVG